MHGIIVIDACTNATAAIELAKLAQRLPALLVADVAAGATGHGLMRVTADAVMRFRQSAIGSLAVAAEADVPLNGATSARFVIFRDAIGGSSTAVIVGQPDMTLPVPVRLHSACLTGDVFGSRRCDCGDQLRLSLRRLDEEGGGIILYLEQEGRGLGLANKIRAYKLQDDGFDTLDANTTLGFDDDERDYGVAARMLQILGCPRVKLLTNNPAKLDGLSQAGIKVSGRIPLHGPVNADNRRYLTAKAVRAGHKLDHLLSALAEPAGIGRAGERGSGRVIRRSRREGGVMVEIRSSTAPAEAGYTLTARVLHWITAALVLVMIPVGIIIANEWGGPAQTFLYNLHKSTGVLLIPLIIIRITLSPDASGAAATGRYPRQSAFRGGGYTLGALWPGPGAAFHRLHHDVGLPGAGSVLRPVQPAGDLAGRSCAVRATVGCPLVCRALHRGHRRHAYRCRSVSPFRARGSYPDAHGSWLRGLSWP